MKTALVTGASEGIGKEFAKHLALEDYKVIAVARNEKKLKELISEIGSGHSYLVADLTTESGLNKIIKVIEEQHFDLLVNNAGIGAVGKFTEIPLEKYKEVWSLNCDAVVKLSYAYLKTATKGDALINTSSSLAFMPVPSIGLYAATKAFVTSLSESLWYEQKSRGVYVMGLCPGMTSTNFNSNAGAVGFANNAPKMMTQKPEQVVDKALKALKSRKKPTVISGSMNNFFIGLTKFMSRKAIVSMMGNMAR